MDFRVRGAVVLLAVLASLGQVGPASAGQAAAQPSAAREALVEGRASDAIRLADALLAKRPGDRDACDVKIRALLSSGDRVRAQRAYEAFVTIAKNEDAGLLAPIAAAELWTLASDGRDLRTQVGALEHLAKSGDRTAWSKLQKMSGEMPGTAQGVTVDAALARLGDAGAGQRLADAVSSSRLRDRSLVADALRDANAAGQAAVLVPLLHDDDPLTRVRAADALGALGYKPAVPDLRALLLDERPSVRATAAVALKRLGDDSGREIVAAMAASSLGATRLGALEASASAKPQERAAAIRLLAADRDPTTRIKAAELMRRTEPAAARKVLAALVAQGDVGVRRDAARALATITPVDVALFRKLLADADPGIRMHAAAGVLDTAALR